MFKKRVKKVIGVIVIMLKNTLPEFIAQSICKFGDCVKVTFSYGYGFVF